MYLYMIMNVFAYDISPWHMHISIAACFCYTSNVYTTSYNHTTRLDYEQISEYLG